MERRKVRNHPDSNKEKTIASRKKSRLLIIVSIIVGIGVITIYSYWLNYTPRSTLQWEKKSEGSPSLGEICSGQRQLYPRSLHTWALPAFSPDRQYYVDIADAKLGKRKMLKVFKTDTQKEVGRYYSSYPSLKIYCWAEDSSGIYVADYERAGTGFGIFQRSSKSGPVKKLLVPE